MACIRQAWDSNGNWKSTSGKSMRGFSDELKRRRVYQSAAIYAVAAWGLAQVIDFVSERLFLPDWIPTLTAIVFVVGFPVAIFLSWTFDLRGYGVHRTEAGSIRGIASLSIAFAMLFGGTALIYSIVWPGRDSNESVVIEAPRNSIAVLPFTTLGDVASSEYLSDGIAEEILYALSSLQDLRVAARTSSFSFKGKGLGIAEVSRALNVRNVLEGSIRIVGDRLNVRVRLIRADSGFALWSESYDRLAEDVFEVQEDIAANIADAIRKEMGIAASSDHPRFRIQTADSEAYRMYLQGRFLWHQRGPENIQAAVAFFTQAIEEDQEFAAAWAGLASAYLTAGTYGAGIENNFEKARDAAERAIELDDQLGEPYGPLAQIHINASRFAEAEILLDQGLQLTPKNTSLRLWVATMMINVGRANEAIENVGLVIDSDPAYPILRANFGMSNFISGNLDTARENFEAAWQLGLRPRFMWQGILFLHFANENFDAADEWIASRPAHRNEEIDTAHLDIYRAWIAAMRAPTAQNRDFVSELLDKALDNNQINLNLAAYAFASIEQPDRALDVLFDVTSKGWYVDQGPLWLPGMKSVRAHERFTKFANALGLVDYWRNVAWADQCGPSENGGVQCFR
jgi:TolB-like protein/thioredoxin-like negative regulator of GroEL